MMRTDMVLEGNLTGVDSLYELLGAQHEMAQVCRALKFDLSPLAAPVVGAMHITCSDESEHECSEAFQHGFAREMLPRLKYGAHVPFRIANAGARYEWGTVAIAEDHFATPESVDAFKIIVVKINSHVAMERTGAGITFGTMPRYGAPSRYCGAIDALLSGSTLPLAEDLRETFLSEGRDRIAALASVDEGHRALFGAVVNARLQARRVVLDIQEHRDQTPTVYVVLHAVSLNESGPDHELVGGVYVLDRRAGLQCETYRGLGDDPARYEFAVVDGRVHVTDDRIGRVRKARDHRRLARERLAKAPRPDVEHHPEWQRLVADVQHGKKAGHPHAKMLLKSAVKLLASLSPVTTGLLLAGEGAAAVYHAHRLREEDGAAQRVLAEIHDTVDNLSPEKAGQVLERIIAEFSAAKP